MSSPYDIDELMLDVFVCYRVPESELSLAHPGEPCGEDVSVFGEDGSHWPNPLMWSQTFLLVGTGSDVTTSETMSNLFSDF